MEDAVDTFRANKLMIYLFRELGREVYVPYEVLTGLYIPSGTLTMRCDDDARGVLVSFEEKDKCSPLKL